MIWPDPSVRYGPFGHLPEVIGGDREAAILPAPGETIRRVRTPPSEAHPPKQVTLTLKLSATGDVEGQGEESYTGFDAALLRENLERVDENQRRQAVEMAALACSFQAAVLDDLVIHDAPGVGALLFLHLPSFHSARFARVEGKRLVVATPIFPAALGQRYVALAARTTPLLINGSELSTTQIHLQPPDGFRASNPGIPANVTSSFGQFRRATHLDGTALVIEEQLEVKLGRVSPTEYPDFVHFTAAADQAQLQEVDFEP